jgi:hypothetical protein
MASRNPTKQTHADKARDKLQSAKSFFDMIVGTGHEGVLEIREELLLHAHTVASQAEMDAGYAGVHALQDEAFQLRNRIEDYLSGLRRKRIGNPARYSTRVFQVPDGRWRWTRLETTPAGSDVIASGVRDSRLEAESEARSSTGPPRENPEMRRFPDLPAAVRDADRRARRRVLPHHVYQVSENPMFVVVSDDHPIHQGTKLGHLAMGDARIRHTANPPEDD